MKNQKFYIVFVFFLLLSSACGIYSFSGAQIGTATTLSIQYFPNKAPLTAPQLSQVFTEKLKSKFVRESSLRLIEKEGDMQISGYISSYEVTPLAVQSNITAAQNRLTITIQVKFVNLTDEKYNFDEVFSNFADFNANVNLSSVESALIEEICDKVVQEVFNKALINW
jgi:hypothetical protein